MPLPRFIDVDTFFADPVFSGASISPDATKLAYLAPDNGRTQVWVRGLDDTHEQAVLIGIAVAGAGRAGLDVAHHRAGIAADLVPCTFAGRLSHHAQAQSEAGIVMAATGGNSFVYE